MTVATRPVPIPGVSAIQLDVLRRDYDNMLACIRCGLCLSVCPTYQITLREEESPRGRIAMARALAEGHLTLTPDLVEHHRTCLLCEACTAICPSGVRMEQLGMPLRAVVEAASPPPVPRRLALGLANRLFGDMRQFRRLGVLLWLYQRSGIQWLARHLGLLRLLGLDGMEGLLPRVDTPFLVPTGQVLRPPVGEPVRRVQLFAGCIMSTAYAEVDRATARVLAAHGCEVVATAGQGCCGALSAHDGDLEGARAMARRNVEAFEPSGDDWVAVNAAGCGAILKEYGHLLAGDPDFAERARAFSARVRDVSEVLDPLEPVVPIRPLARRVTYQDPCHLAHAQRVVQQPRRLLRRIPGLELVELADASTCCGSAGIYNVLEPAMAEALRDRKVKNILATGADVVVSANPGCMIQIQAGLRAERARVHVAHLIELLDESLDGPLGEAHRP